MRTDAAVEHSFPKEDPVCAYWLARCERFAVHDGRRSGVVEQIALDESLRPEHLVVRYALRREVVPAARVDAVVPARELLVLDDPPPRLAPAVERTRRIAPVAARAGHASARAVVAAAAWGAVAAALLAQLALGYGRRAALASARVAASATGALANKRERRAVPAEAAARERRRRAARRRDRKALTPGR